MAFDSMNFLKYLTESPGVYQMFSENGDIIYIGKASNLKNRVSSYFSNTSSQSLKTQSLVASIAEIKTIITNTESEALILENRLIKEYLPRYNILLRDDKTYPYIQMDSEHDFPMLSLYRGGKKKNLKYFGPYPNVGSAKQSLANIYKVFHLRQCNNSGFSNRSRPCLQHQIGRCMAPCCGYITKEQYQEQLQKAVLFLEGRSSYLIDTLVNEMNESAEKMEYEKAAELRDQIFSLRQSIETQAVEGESGDLDIIAAVAANGVTCIQVTFIRNGQNIGSKSFFPQNSKNSNEAEVIAAFLPQYYLRHTPQSEIITSHNVPEKDVLEQVFGEILQKKVEIKANVRANRRLWLDLALKNASVSLSMKLAANSTSQKRFQQLAEFLGLDEFPQRIECFDISHTSGEATIASCVVFSPEGAQKQDYRRFSIKGITGGDDFAAMRQAITRRYGRLLKEDGIIPEILLIDGGKGQLAQAIAVMDELQLNDVMIIGIAKGEGRKPGLEKIIIPSKLSETDLPTTSEVLHLLQHIRDEAHRFAVAGHRSGRAKNRRKSVLESIEGLGVKRRQTLLQQFGGLQGIAKAEISDLCKVKGISKKIATAVYDLFHDEENKP